jgi:hypothetical protein
MLPALETIQSSVAPVVMISANGLLCLTFYNRLSAFMTRSRTINKERFDLATRALMLAKQEPQDAEIVHLRRRVEVLDEVGHRLMAQIRWVRGTLLCLLLSVLCMLTCSLALGLSTVGAKFAWLAVGLFLAGAALMIFGILMAIVDLQFAMDALIFEHREMESGLCPNFPE